MSGFFKNFSDTPNKRNLLNHFTKKGKRIGRPPKTPEKDSPSACPSTSFSGTPNSKNKTDGDSKWHIDNSNRPFPCNFCQRRFHTKAKVQLHKQNAHPDELVFQNCNLCRRIFIGVTALNEHKDHHHRSLTAAPNNSIPAIKCSYCSGVFHEEIALENHLRFYHLEEECLGCGTVVHGAFGMMDHVSDYHQPKMIPGPWPGHQCKICWAIFPQLHQVFDHFRRRHVYHWNCISVPKQLHACPHCQLPFSSWKQMHHHVIQKHQGYGEYYFEPDYVAVEEDLGE